MVFFSEMVILVVFNIFNVVKTLKKPELVARQKPPFLSVSFKFIPTCTTIDKAKLEIELEAFGRMLRLKWFFQE